MALGLMTLHLMAGPWQFWGPCFLNSGQIYIFKIVKIFKLTIDMDGGVYWEHVCKI